MSKPPRNTLRRALVSACVAFGLLSLPAMAEDAPAAIPYSWSNADILGGGFVPGVVFHPTQKGLVYARTDIGGAYRFDEANNRWVQLLDFLGRDDARLYGVLSIALDPHDPDRVYMATGEYTQANQWNRKGAVLISTDRGETWAMSNLPFYLGGNEDGRSTGERLQVDPNLGANLFLGTTKNGLWRSTDHGATWQQTSLPAKHVLFVLYDAQSGTKGKASQTLYAGSEDKTGQSLWISKDGGETWAVVPGTPTGLMPHHAEFDHTGKLYLTFADAPGPNGLKDGAVKIYDPKTHKWRDITPIKPGTEPFGYAGLSFDRQKPGTLVVSTLNRWASGDEVFRSTDGGQSWKGVSAKSHFDTTPAPWLLAYSGGKHDRIGHWIGDIDIDPFNSDRVFYVTGYGVWETRNLTDLDRNKTLDWLFTNKGLEETAVLEVISAPDTPEHKAAPVISALGDIGGFRHDDLTSAVNSTYFVPNGLHTRGMDFAGLKPNLIVRSADRAPHGFYSEDAGKTWTAFASAPPTITTRDYQTMGIAVSADGATWVWMPRNSEAYVSADKGKTWVKSTGGPTNKTHIFPISDRVNPKRLYLFDPQARVFYQSTDGGYSFKAVAQNLPEWAGRVRAIAGHEGHLILGHQGGLMRTTDGGASWATTPGVDAAWTVASGKPAPDSDYPALFIWGRIAGVEGFFLSPDQGVSWHRLGDDRLKFGSVRGVMTGDPKVYGRLYVGTDGRGVIIGDIKK